MRRWPQRRIEIDIASQKLTLFDAEEVLLAVAVSTAKNGAGERAGSECTPRGLHRIRAKIGLGQPENAVFVGRRPTGEIYSSDLAARFPGRDWILTRILWLSGCETGRNRLGDVDTMRRYIYIHGTPESVPMGVAGSRGCVRMRNRELLHLFDLVEAGTPVLIRE
jgi:lipoprotein-anchoring transpeptidase ErfK/SrfK